MVGFPAESWTPFINCFSDSNVDSDMAMKVQTRNNAKRMTNGLDRIPNRMFCKYTQLFNNWR